MKTLIPIELHWFTVAKCLDTNLVETKRLLMTTFLLISTKAYIYGCFEYTVWSPLCLSCSRSSTIFNADFEWTHSGLRQLALKPFGKQCFPPSSSHHSDLCLIFVLFYSVGSRYAILMSPFHFPRPKLIEIRVYVFAGRLKVTMTLASKMAVNIHIHIGVYIYLFIYIYKSVEQEETSFETLFQ